MRSPRAPTPQREESNCSVCGSHSLTRVVCHLVAATTRASSGEEQAKYINLCCWERHGTSRLVFAGNTDANDFTKGSYQVYNLGVVKGETACLWCWSSSLAYHIGRKEHPVTPLSWYHSGLYAVTRIFTMQETGRTHTPTPTQKLRGKHDQ